MKRIFIVLGIILFLLMVFYWGCSSGPEINRPPSISSIIAEPESIFTGGSTTITCFATDPDGDNLTYTWNSYELGTFTGSGATVTWTPPDTFRNFWIKCTVADEDNRRDRDSVQVYVGVSFPFEGIVAYYPFEGDAQDRSENGNDAVVYGATLTEDRFGNPSSAYQFDGINDYMEVLDNDLLDLTSGITISLWIRPEAVMTSGRYLFIKKKQWETSADYDLDIIPGRIRAILSNVGGGHPLYGSTVIQDDQWQHLVLTWNGSIMKVFYNGHQDGTRDALGTIPAGSGNLEIGTFSGDSPQYFYKGIIDDIRLYNRGLLNEEVLLLYHENGWDQDKIASGN